MMNISDYPLSEKLQSCFPFREEICDYYERYMQEFNEKQRKITKI